MLNTSLDQKRKYDGLFRMSDAAAAVWESARPEEAKPSSFKKTDLNKIWECGGMNNQKENMQPNSNAQILKSHHNNKKTQNYDQDAKKQILT